MGIRYSVAKAYKENMLIAEKEMNENKPYVAQIIDNSRKKTYASNWYNDLVGQLVIVNKRYVGGLSKCYQVSETVKITDINRNKDYWGNGFDDSDIKIIGEYVIPVKTFKMSNGTVITEDDVKSIKKWIEDEGL